MNTTYSPKQKLWHNGHRNRSLWLLPEEDAKLRALAAENDVTPGRYLRALLLLHIERVEAARCQLYD